RRQPGRAARETRRGRVCRGGKEVRAAQAAERLPLDGRGAEGAHGVRAGVEAVAGSIDRGVEGELRRAPGWSWLEPIVGAITMGARQNAAFDAAGSSTVTWQS